MLAEANHRIANSLTLLTALMDSQAKQLLARGQMIDPREAASLLHECRSRLTTVGALHRLLSEQPCSRMDFGVYLRELAPTLVNCLASQGGVRLDCRGIEPGNVIAADDALPLALAVAELITNAIKYAHPGGTSGRLWLGCRTTESGAFVVTVSDDGVGLPEGFVPGDGSSLGFRTVRSLMRQIGATISFETDSLGLSITLTLPPRGRRQ